MPPVLSSAMVDGRRLSAFGVEPLGELSKVAHSTIPTVESSLVTYCAYLPCAKPGFVSKMFVVSDVGNAMVSALK